MYGGVYFYTKNVQKVRLQPVLKIEKFIYSNKIYKICVKKYH